MANKKRGRKAPLVFTGFNGKDYKAMREAISVFKGFGIELSSKGLHDVASDLVAVELNLRHTLNKMQACSKAVLELKAKLKQAQEKGHE